MQATILFEGDDAGARDLELKLRALIPSSTTESDHVTIPSSKSSLASTEVSVTRECVSQDQASSVASDTLSARRPSGDGAAGDPTPCSPPSSPLQASSQVHKLVYGLTIDPMDFREVLARVENEVSRGGGVLVDTTLDAVARRNSDLCEQCAGTERETPRFAVATLFPLPPGSLARGYRCAAVAQVLTGLPRDRAHPAGGGMDSRVYFLGKGPMCLWSSLTGSKALSSEPYVSRDLAQRLRDTLAPRLCALGIEHKGMDPEAFDFVPTVNSTGVFVLVSSGRSLPHQAIMVRRVQAALQRAWCRVEPGAPAPVALSSDVVTGDTASVIAGCFKPELAEIAKMWINTLCDRLIRDAVECRSLGEDATLERLGVVHTPATHGLFEAERAAGGRVSSLNLALEFVRALVTPMFKTRPIGDGQGKTTLNTKWWPLGGNHGGKKTAHEHIDKGDLLDGSVNGPRDIVQATVVCPALALSPSRTVTRFFHGTCETSANSILDGGIRIVGNTGLQLDFGPGFYVTKDFHRAVYYAAMKSFGSRERCAVIAFDIDDSGRNEFWNAVVELNDASTPWTWVEVVDHYAASAEDYDLDDTPMLSGEISNRGPGGTPLRPPTPVRGGHQMAVKQEGRAIFMSSAQVAGVLTFNG
jgi:hypothetical protein